MKRKLRLHYSGRLSKAFWDAVWSLPQQEWDAAYTAGVKLQELEAEVLKLLPDAEKEQQHVRGS